MPSEEPSNHERFASLAQRLRVFQPSPFPGPARAGAITEAEAELGVTFPISYRLFLEQFSGSGLPFQIYGVEPETEPEGRQWYFDHVVGMTLSERQEVEPALSHFLIPFTPNGMGDHWCLDTSRLVADECPVVFWSHERDEDQEPVQTHATFLDWLEEMTADEFVQEYYQDERNFADAL